MNANTFSGNNPSGHSPVREGMIAVPGGNVYYRVFGADKPGIPLLVVHGGPGAPHNYLLVLQALADERPVVFYDQLGCGKSERPSDTTLWNIPRFVEELSAVREFLKLDSVHLLGQSWGTMLAVSYLLQKHPGGVRSLILSGPYLSTKRWVADQEVLVGQMNESDRNTIRKSEASGRYDSPEYQHAMNEFYKKHLCRLDPWPQELNITFENLGVEVYTYMWGPSEFTMTGTLKDADVTPWLSGINTPVLLTAGEFDEARPETVEYYKCLFRKAEIQIFKDSSHSHHLEKSFDFVRSVRDFIHQNE